MAAATPLAADGRLIAEHLLGISCYYTAYKLGVRLALGCEEDERGWGRPETYVCAFVHQSVVAALGLACIARNADGSLEPWLLAGWQMESRARSTEMLIMLANVAEMLTDWLLYSRYRGFRSGYHLHHLLTVSASLAFIQCETAPVGFAIAYSSVMELGGAFLNLSSLVPSRLTFALRPCVYVLSRLVATALLALCTAYALRGRIGVPLAALAPVWILALLNLRWATDLFRAALRRQEDDPWSITSPSASPMKRE